MRTKKEKPTSFALASVVGFSRETDGLILMA